MSRNPKESSVLTLSEALETGRLQEFIAEREAEGVGPVSEAEFDETASTLIKKPLSDDQTSRSPRSGDLPGK